MSKATNSGLLPGESCDSEWCEVRRSGIHGRGVFACKDIPADTAIIQYVGEKIDKEESDIRGWAQMDRHNETGEAAVYIFTLDDDWDIDGDVPENAARLINHGCEPNCEAYIEDGEIWIWSIQDIADNEELLFNYGFDLENWEDHPCECGAPACPGYIAGKDFWPELRNKIAEKKEREWGETAPVETLG